MAKTNSGLLEFKDDQKVLIALDAATSEVKKAVIIAADGTETDIAGGGSGVTVEALSVTENGTYSEEGKAYSPVTVNVAGGSSDFSTAEVTVSPSDGLVELNGSVPVILDDEGEFITCVDYLENGYNVVLFNGSFILVTTVEPAYTVSGNASLETLAPIMPTDPTRYKLTITGDCTITVSE